MMHLANKHIFIVEDNPQNRIVFQMLLVRNGAKVDFERWGKDAIHRLKFMNNISLIILDLALSDNVSGYDIFDEIRTMPQFDHVPVVAVSATDYVTGIPKAKAKGFNGFIAKPIDDNRFPQQLARIINGETIWDAGGVAIEDEEV